MGSAFVRVSAMGNALAVPVHPAVAAPFCHASVRAGEHVHCSTRVGPGLIVSIERDGQRANLSVLAGPENIAAAAPLGQASEMGNTSRQASATGNEFTVPVQGRIVPGERWAARSPSRSYIKSQQA